ncbi:MAG: mannose-6-phosphate isomerase, partial [Coprobacillus sp.]
MAFQYNKQPYVEVKGYGNNDAWSGYKDIVKELNNQLLKIEKDRKVLVIDFYPGVRKTEIEEGIINQLNAQLSIFTDDDIFEDIDTVEAKIKDVVTDDRVFGKISLHSLDNFIDQEGLKKAKDNIEKATGLVVVYGVGANLLVEPDVYVYADMARWEIQQRYRAGDIPNWKGKNYNEDPLRKLKRGYFFEWRVADRYKKRRFNKFDFILDTNLKNSPKMITGKAFKAGLKETVHQPFRVVPFFDPGVWGGQWMKEVCDLDRNMDNYAWCFDCVPEENSLLLKVGDVI